MRSSFKKLFLIFVVFLAVVFVVLGYFAKSASAPRSMYVPPIPSVTPTPEPVKDVQVNSADGTMKIAMRRITMQDGRISYSFIVSDISETNEKVIFTKVLASKIAMSIPQNTWSPDNRYLFLHEYDAATSSFFVFNASGESFPDGSAYVSLSDLYAKDGINYSLKDVTGWDSDTLLHVLTSGPSFWFEVPSRNFIQLATK